MLSGYGATYTVITSEDVTKTLLEKYARRGLREDVSSAATGTAFSVRSGNYIICHECGQKGHIRPKCPKLRKKKTNYSSNKQDTSVSATSFSSNKPNTNNKHAKNTTLLTAFATGSFDPESFYLDSCVTNHISNRFDWMMNFNAVTAAFSTADKNILYSKGSGEINHTLVNSTTQSMNLLL